MTVTYGDLESAPVVLLVGFEPEEESPIVFLRLRKAARTRGLQVHSIAPFATRGLTKMTGTLMRTAPGEEAIVLDDLRRGEAVELLHQPGAVILVGERLGLSPGRSHRRPGSRTRPARGWRGFHVAQGTAVRWKPARCPTYCPAAGPVAASVVTPPASWPRRHGEHWTRC